MAFSRALNMLKQIIKQVETLGIFLIMIIVTQIIKCVGNVQNALTQIVLYLKSTNNK